MSNNFLLGIIGVLLVTATGVGVVGATSNPQFASEASSKVSDIADGVLTQVQTTAQKFGLNDSDNSAKIQSTTTVKQEDSNKSDGDSDTKVSKPKTTTQVASKRSDTENERDSEGDDEEEGDDDWGGGRSGAPVQSAPAQTNPTPVVTPPTQSTGTTFTMAQVAAHGTASSCYTTIGGIVYDLTPFITQHPGGKSTISRLCGIEGTAEFNAQHGGQGNPAAELASLKIGTLAQ